MFNMNCIIMIGSPAVFYQLKNKTGLLKCKAPAENVQSWAGLTCSFKYFFNSPLFVVCLIILAGMPLSPRQLSETGDAISFPLVLEDLHYEPVYGNRIKN